MNADGVFRISLAASVLLHVGLLVGHHEWRHRPVVPPPDRVVEVTYFNIAHEPEIRPTHIPNATAADAPPELDATALADRSATTVTTPPPQHDTESVPTSRPSPDLISATESVDLTQLPETVTDEPAYLDYFRAIRARIQWYAQRARPDRWVEGAVHLSFILNADGHVMHIQILDPGSSSHYVLRRASVRSIQQASPFPPFPASIQREFIPLNITIYFKLSH